MFRHSGHRRVMGARTLGGPRDNGFRDGHSNLDLPSEMPAAQEQLGRTSIDLNWRSSSMGRRATSRMKPLKGPCQAAGCAPWLALAFCTLLKEHSAPPMSSFHHSIAALLQLTQSRSGKERSQYRRSIHIEYPTGLAASIVHVIAKL